MVLKTIEEAIRAASAGKQRKVLSVAVPEDPHTLEAVLRAAREGYVCLLYTSRKPWQNLGTCYSRRKRALIVLIRTMSDSLYRQ